MTYLAYCLMHSIPCSPLYWRPDGKTFRRVYGFLYCPGKDNDPHLCREVFDRWQSKGEPLDTS